MIRFVIKPQYFILIVLIVFFSCKKNEKRIDVVSYHTNGKISTIIPYKIYEDKDSLMDGVIRTFYKNGAKKDILPIHEGIRKGAYIGYHLNGNLKVSGVMKDDKEDSIWYHFKENGSLRKMVYFDNGEIVHSYSYKDAGPVHKASEKIGAYHHELQF
ncbi:hypothetical protein FUAX_54160 (plasmid) [Fulvitalea axinellae]|uniref:Toxin-antitoxin system YwqK family antitoxin n=1 Tax=Fulvitalea axinellae TaxID=1182444 RepID=A0AAU9D322_9BACT|nr:hypothetical protein FUAX_54160 [Fulvitalea axinellae]